MNKLRRTCIFCNNYVDSKEHVWPTWMHELLDGNPMGKYNRQTINRHPSGAEEVSGPTGKPGNVFNIQVRAVCRQCNNGWMSIKEGEVKPFLELMVAGTPVTITSAQVELLAKWCALKFIVMEHSSVGTSLTPLSDRIAFKENGDIPPYFRIYVGNHLSKARSAAARHSHTLSLSPNGPVPPLDGTNRNIQTISIILGRIFIHINAARIDGFSIEDNYFVTRIWDECRIWPDPNCALSWPHRPAPDNEGLFAISNALQAISSSPNVKWSEGP